MTKEGRKVPGATEEDIQLAIAKAQTTRPRVSISKPTSSGTRHLEVRSQFGSVVSGLLAPEGDTINAYAEHIAVKKELRNHGIGKTLIRCFAEVSKQEGAETLYACALSKPAVRMMQGAFESSSIAMQVYKDDRELTTVRPDEAIQTLETQIQAHGPLWREYGGHVEELENVGVKVVVDLERIQYGYPTMY